MDCDETLFEGAAVELLESLPKQTGRYAARAVSRTHHLTGYGPFVRFIRQHGGSASALAADTTGLIKFAREHQAELLTDAALLSAGAVFFGNALVRRARAAAWEWPAERPIEVRQRHASPSFPVERVFPALLTADRGRLAEFEEVLLEWDEAEVVSEGAERRLALPSGPRWAPAPFTMPSPAAPVWRGMRTLLEYLLEQYVAWAVEEDVALAATFPHPPAEVRRVLRLTSAPDAAALTIAFTATGVVVHAGALQDFEYQDSWGGGWQAIADVMLAVAAGAYREAYPIGRRRLAGYAVGLRDGGWERSQGPVAELSPALLDASEARLATLTSGWAPWPLRQS